MKLWLKACILCSDFFCNDVVEELRSITNTLVCSTLEMFFIRGGLFSVCWREVLVSWKIIRFSDSEGFVQTTEAFKYLHLKTNKQTNPQHLQQYSCSAGGSSDGCSQEWSPVGIASLSADKWRNSTGCSLGRRKGSCFWDGNEIPHGAFWWEKLQSK